MKAIILIMMMVFSFGAYAEGGEGDNTGCNGEGNPNSPCDGGDNGGGANDGGGGGGDIFNENNNTNDIVNRNTNRNNNTNTQGQLQGQLQGQAQVVTVKNGFSISPSTSSNSNSNSNSSSSSSSDNSVTITSNSYGSDVSKRVPSMGAPSVNNSYNPYSCLKGASGSIALSGFGGALSNYTMDENCDARVTSGQLMKYGMADHAIQVLCTVDSMREADAKLAEANGVAPQCIENRKSSNNKTSSTKKSDSTFDADVEIW
jgi:hypothetical protein